MDRERAVIAALAVAGSAAVVGLVAYLGHRRRDGRDGLGRPGRRSVPNIETRRADGMTLRHYRNRELPIQERVGIIQDLVFESVHDPRMRKIALGITRNCPARDDKCEARAIHDWVKRNIRYTGDVGMVKFGRHGPVEGVDLFQSAYRTVEFGGGDCDDHSILNATLLALNGISPGLAVTAPKRRGAQWAHIYATAKLPKGAPTKTVALDTTLPYGGMGTEAPYGKRRDFVA